MKIESSLAQQSRASSDVLQRKAKRVPRRYLRSLHMLHKGGRHYRWLVGTVIGIDPKVTGLRLMVRAEGGEVFTMTAPAFEASLCGMPGVMLVAMHRGKGFDGLAYTHLHLIMSRAIGSGPAPASLGAFARALGGREHGGDNPGRRHAQTGDWDANPDEQPTWKRIRPGNLPVALILDTFVGA
jgi:hypothetical protein